MKILITDKMANEAIQLLKDAGHEVTFDEMDHDTLLKEIGKYDALMVRGRTKVVKEIINEKVSTGLHQIKWDGLNEFNTKVSSGTYLLILQSETNIQKRKILYLK